MRNCSEGEQNTQPPGVEGHDLMEDVPGESFEATLGQESSGQDDPSEMLLVSTLQPNSPAFIQRETECPDSNDQSIQPENFAQVDNMQRNQGNQISRMDANENIDVESEEFGVQNDSNRREIVNTYCAADHLQVIKRKYPLRASGQPDYTGSPKRTRPSQNRTAGLTTHQRSSSRTAISRKKPFLEKQKACLDTYISQHTTKYRELGLPCPGEFLGREETRRRLAGLKLENYANVLRVLNFTIGGYESLVGLKEVLRAYRDPNVGLLITTQEVPNAKRLQAIQSLERNGAYMNLLKKCHIHRLFIDNVDPLRNPNDNFIVSTSNSTDAAGELGNPRNSAESRITKSMMKEVYPNMDSNSADYKKKYREITALRRNGRRLDVLVSYFGKGILGLLPLVQDDSTSGMAYIFADTMQVLSPFNFQLD